MEMQATTDLHCFECPRSGCAGSQTGRFFRQLDEAKLTSGEYVDLAKACRRCGTELVITKVTDAEHFRRIVSPITAK